MRFLVCASAACGLTAAPGRVLVLDDFESPASTGSWKGEFQLVNEHAAHGRASARVTFAGRSAEFSAMKPHPNWRGFDRLRFDIHSARQDNLTATLRIYDEAGVASGARRDYYEADEQILILPGWNHVELELAGLQAASYRRRIALDRIRRVVVSLGRVSGPCSLHFDNFRLIEGEEPRESASLTRPQDAVTILKDRFFQVRQVASPDEVPESAEVARLRERARRETALLGEAIRAAQTQGIETIYAERHLVTADLGLQVRPLLAWFNNDPSKREMFDYVARSCREARARLQRTMEGRERLAAIDDTQVGEPLVRPYPPLKGRPIRDGFFRDERGEPMMVISLHSPSRLLERFFATPRQHIESYSVGGGSRWTIEQSPVYAAFQADPDTHRVGWDGWCGHLVRDLDSMGTSKPENTVICLESPRIREAIEAYIRLNTPRFHSNPELLYDILAYELMYICYCDRSQRAFRGWLAAEHGSVAEANRKWGTSYTSFDAVSAPPVKGARPLPDVNRGLWYDWARFNQDRFTNHLLWVRDLVRKIDPSVPLAAGGSSSMLSGSAGTAGIDEERIVNEVDDLVIHEGGASTLGLDLQLALAESRKPLADPEMNLGSVYDLLPHLLHGKSVVQIWHWPSQPGNEFHGNNRSSLAHGRRFSLSDVGELLRVALDGRRLNNEIAAFSDAPAQAAILYSRTATLQLPPEMLTWRTTPYLDELRVTYEASRTLDTRVTFVTERQVLKDRLQRFKILLIPAVANLPSAVVAKIWDFASHGGRVLLVPDSLRADEYNRPAAYLERLGIRIQETRAAQAGVEGTERTYYQTFEERVRFLETKPVTLRPEPGGIAAAVGELRTRGPSQKATAAGAQILYRDPANNPMLWRIPVGNGTVYYSATALEPSGYTRLLDTLFADAGLDRPVRVRPADTGRVEARATKLGGRRLLYVVNGAAQPARLTVESKAWPFRGLRELRDGVETTGGEITVPPRQTGLYELQP